MREIKVRGWNTRTKVMLYFQDMIPFSRELFGTEGVFIPLSKHIELMQFTGLKDKNGKEIFEEDIVKHTDGNVGVVYYWETKATFMVDFHDLGDPDGYHDQFDSYDMGYEVIGNIHENPKLLGKQNE